MRYEAYFFDAEIKRSGLGGVIHVASIDGEAIHHVLGVSCPSYLFTVIRHRPASGLTSSKITV